MLYISFGDFVIKTIRALHIMYNKMFLKFRNTKYSCYEEPPTKTPHPHPHANPQSYKLLSPLPFCSSPVTRPSPGGLPSWSFHFQSIPRTTLLPTFRCFSICERMRRRWRRKAASTSRAALPGHRDQQGFSDLASFSPAVTPLEDDCSGPVCLESIYK